MLSRTSESYIAIGKQMSTVLKACGETPCSQYRHCIMVMFGVGHIAGITRVAHARLSCSQNSTVAKQACAFILVHLHQSRMSSFVHSETMLCSRIDIPQLLEH